MLRANILSQDELARLVGEGDAPPHATRGPDGGPRREHTDVDIWVPVIPRPHAALADPSDMRAVGIGLLEASPRELWPPVHRLPATGHSEGGCAGVRATGARAAV
jgi:hypothetical protein